MSSSSTTEPEPGTGQKTKPLPLPLPSLILLPPPPRPATRSTLSAAYRPPLEAAISKLLKAEDGDSDGDGATLVIAVAAPFLAREQARPHRRSLSWPDAQTLIAGLYGIVSVICARHGVPTEVRAGPGSVDARVVLVDHEPGRRYAGEGEGGGAGGLAFSTTPAVETNNTIVVDLASFAAAYHPWHRIYRVDTEAGNALLSTYLRLLERRVLQPKPRPLRQDQLVTVPGGLAMSVAGSSEVDRSSPSSSQPTVTPLRRTVCLGGTFDHLHPGHKLLLHAAVLLLDVPTAPAQAPPTIPCRLIVGITGDELLRRKKYAELVQPWDQRAAHVVDFLSTVLGLSPRGWSGGGFQQSSGDARSGGREEAKAGDDDYLGTSVVARRDRELVVGFRGAAIEVQCVVIHDMYGPTATREDVDALVVSGETRSGGQAVNEKRAELGWHALDIFEVDVLDAEETDNEGGSTTTTTTTATADFASKISSSAIRKQRAEAAATGTRHA